MNKSNCLILKECYQLLTCDSKKDNVLGILSNVSVLIKDGIIKDIGNYDDFIDDNCDCKVIDCSENVVLPGFVDSHTHTVFGGERIEEYVDKLVPSSPNKIKRNYEKKGLEKSISETRSESKSILIKTTLDKIDQMILSGTTTVEIKSGYGIDFDTEIKQLEVINHCKKYNAIDVHATYLGAHFWDTEMGKEKYIEFMINDMMPYIHKNNLAEFCDIWLDDGYYTAEEAEKVLENAKKFGMKSKLHTECYSNIGGVLLAGRIKAMSADHLNFIDDEGIKALVDNDVVGVLLPGTDYSVNHPKPFKARPILDSGMKVALATNMNPGNWVTSMPFIIDLACRKHQFEPEEAILAATKGGAQALGIESSVGCIKIGMKADIQIWNTNDYKDIVYKHGFNPVKNVIKNGVIVVDNNQLVNTNRKEML